MLLISMDEDSLYAQFIREKSIITSEFSDDDNGVNE